MAHTPGPWRRRIISGNAGTLVEAKDDSAYVAAVNYRGSVERTNADCNLIAAAPALLAAAKQLIDDEDERTRPDFDQLRAAIALAEGRS